MDVDTDDRPEYELLPEPELDLENLFVFIQVPTASGELCSYCTDDADLVEMDEAGKLYLGPFVILERQRHISAVIAMDRHVGSLEREHREQCDMLREMYTGACNELHYWQEQAPRPEHSSGEGGGQLGRAFGTWHALAVLTRSHREELNNLAVDDDSGVTAVRELWIQQGQRHRRHTSTATVFGAWRFCVLLSAAERAHQATLDQQAAESLTQHRALMDSVAEAEVRHREMLELQMEVMQHAQKTSARAVALAAHPSSNYSGSEASFEVQSVDSSPTSQQQVPLSHDDRTKFLKRIRVLTDELRLDQEAHSLELQAVRAECDTQLVGLTAELEHVKTHSAKEIADLRAQLELERARVAEQTTGGREPQAQQHQDEAEQMHSSSAHSEHYDGGDKDKENQTTEERLRSLLQGMEAWEVAEMVTRALAPVQEQPKQSAGNGTDVAGRGGFSNPSAVTISYHVVSPPSDEITSEPTSTIEHVVQPQEGEASGDKPDDAEESLAVPQLDSMGLQQAIPGWMRRPRELLRLDEAETGRVICALQEDDARTILAGEGLTAPAADSSLEDLHRQLLVHFGCAVGPSEKGEGEGEGEEEEEEEEETPRSASATARLRRLLAMEPHDGEVLLLSPLSAEEVGAAVEQTGEGIGTANTDEDDDSPPSRRSPLAEQRRLALLAAERFDDEHEVILLNPAVERLSSAELNTVVLPDFPASEDGGDASGSNGGGGAKGRNDGQESTLMSTLAADNPPAPPSSVESRSSDEDWLSGSSSGSEQDGVR